MQNHKGFRKENVKVWEAAFLLKSSSEPLGLDLDLDPPPQDQSPWVLTLGVGFPGNLFSIHFII